MKKEGFMTQNNTSKKKLCPFAIIGDSMYPDCSEDCAWHNEKYGCAIAAIPALADALEDGFMIQSDKPFFDEEDDSDDY